VSRRSERNQEYLRARQHERDRNIPGLIGDLGSGEPLIRGHVVRVLANLGAKETASHIAKLTDDPDDTVRSTAYTALGELRAEGAMELLFRGLDDPVPVVRMGAADGLAALRDNSAVSRLRGALANDTHPEVRYCLANTLVTLRDKEVLKELSEVLRAVPRRMRLSGRWKELKRAADSHELPPTY
jgi:HEAT repeat protein